MIYGLINDMSYLLFTQPSTIWDSTTKKWVLKALVYWNIMQQTIGSWLQDMSQFSSQLFLRTMGAYVFWYLLALQHTTSCSNDQCIGAPGIGAQDCKLDFSDKETGGRRPLYTRIGWKNLGVFLHLGLFGVFGWDFDPTNCGVAGFVWELGSVPMLKIPHFSNENWGQFGDKSSISWSKPGTAGLEGYCFFFEIRLVFRIGSNTWFFRCHHPGRRTQDAIVQDAAWYVKRILPIAILQTANVVMKLCCMEVPNLRDSADSSMNWPGWPIARIHQKSIAVTCRCDFRRLETAWR